MHTHISNFKARRSALLPDARIAQHAKLAIRLGLVRACVCVFVCSSANVSHVRKCVLYNMNCAGGIMKCDVIAAGIVSAAKQVGGVSWRTHGNCAEIVSAAVVDVD
jgi:hypothetical protein